MHHLNDKNPPETAEPIVKYNSPNIRIDDVVVRRRRATDDGEQRL